jgi:hypothetical protein
MRLRIHFWIQSFIYDLKNLKGEHKSKRASKYGHEELKLVQKDGGIAIRNFRLRSE